MTIYVYFISTRGGVQNNHKENYEGERGQSCSKLGYCHSISQQKKGLGPVLILEDGRFLKDLLGLGQNSIDICAHKGPFPKKAKLFEIN